MPYVERRSDQEIRTMDRPVGVMSLRLSNVHAGYVDAIAFGWTSDQVEGCPECRVL